MTLNASYFDSVSEILVWQRSKEFFKLLGDNNRQIVDEFNAAETNAFYTPTTNSLSIY